VNQNLSADHARHDRLSVLRFLDRDPDLRPAEIEQTRKLLAACSDCAALASEMQLISDSMVSMALPSRPRDFRINREQAASLKPGGLRRFFRRPPAHFGFGMLQPLAGAVVAIGLLLVVAGSLPVTPGPQRGTLVFSAAPSAAPGGNVGTQEYPTDTPATSAPAMAGAPSGDDLKSGPMAPSSETQEINPDPSPIAQLGVPTNGDGGGVVRATAANDAAPPGSDPERSRDADQPAAVLSPLVVFGGMLAAVGLMIVALTYLARRMGRAI
jgi:hypothetical protein